MKRSSSSKNKTKTKKVRRSVSNNSNLSIKKKNKLNLKKNPVVNKSKKKHVKHLVKNNNNNNNRKRKPNTKKNKVGSNKTKKRNGVVNTTKRTLKKQHIGGGGGGSGAYDMPVIGGPGQGQNPENPYEVAQSVIDQGQSRYQKLDSDQVILYKRAITNGNKLRENYPYLRDYFKKNDEYLAYLHGIIENKQKLKQFKTNLKQNRDQNKYKGDYLFIGDDKKLYLLQKKYKKNTNHIKQIKVDRIKNIKYEQKYKLTTKDGILNKYIQGEDTSQEERSSGSSIYNSLKRRGDHARKKAILPIRRHPGPPLPTPNKRRPVEKQQSTLLKVAKMTHAGILQVPLYSVPKKDKVKIGEEDKVKIGEEGSIIELGKQRFQDDFENNQNALTNIFGNHQDYLQFYCGKIDRVISKTYLTEDKQFLFRYKTEQSIVLSYKKDGKYWNVIIGNEGVNYKTLDAALIDPNLEDIITKKSNGLQCHIYDSLNSGAFTRSQEIKSIEDEIFNNSNDRFLKFYHGEITPELAEKMIKDTQNEALLLRSDIDITKKEESIYLSFYDKNEKKVIHVYVSPTDGDNQKKNLKFETLDNALIDIKEKKGISKGITNNRYIIDIAEEIKYIASFSNLAEALHELNDPEAEEGGAYVSMHPETEISPVPFYSTLETGDALKKIEDFDETLPEGSNKIRDMFINDPKYPQNNNEKYAQYFHGKMSGQEAISIFNNEYNKEKDNIYLLRYSDRQGQLFASFKINGTFGHSGFKTSKGIPFSIDSYFKNKCVENGIEYENLEGIEPDDFEI